MRKYFYVPKKFRKERNHIRLRKLMRVTGPDLGLGSWWNLDEKRKSENILSREIVRSSSVMRHKPGKGQ